MNNIQTFEPHQGNPADGRINVSLAGGTECWLQVDDYRVSIWASNWTGREIVRVQHNGSEAVVSDKHSFAFKTPHLFELDGHCFRLNFKIGLGRAEVTLYRNGELFDAARLDRNCIPIDPATDRVDWMRASIQLGLPLIGGLAFGASLGYLASTLFQ